MKKNLLFLGNDGNILKKIGNISSIRVMGVVGDEVSEKEKKYFGSSAATAKKWKIPLVSQFDFNRDYGYYLSTAFKGTELIFVQGYHCHIKKDLLDADNIKVVNFHQSMLPKYRGRHPLNWALVNGEKSTGITFHYVSEDFDEGDIIFQKKLTISKSDSVISLYNKTIALASKYIGKVFLLIQDCSFVPKAQDANKMTYFPPRKPEDGEILKSDTIRRVKDKIRALTFPYPGAYVCSDGERVIVERVRVLRHCRQNKGTRLVNYQDGSVIINAKDGVLKVLKTRD